MIHIGRKVIFAMALASACAAPLGAQTMPEMPGVPPPPTYGDGVANGSFRQHDMDRITAEGRVRDGGLLTGDNYALRSTLHYVSGLSEEFVSPAKLLELRAKRLDNLIARNKRDVEWGDDRQPVVRDRVLLLDPSAAHLATAAGLGFKVSDDRTEAALGLRLVVLGAPKGMGSAKAAAALNAAAPGIGAEVDPIFEPAGESVSPSAGIALAGAQGVAAASASAAIAMIDGGVGEHPALQSSRIEQQGFSGKMVPTGHGTAVASLLVGNLGPFRGSAPGARLLVGDIFGGNPAKGSASAMVRALGWAAGNKPVVVAISLVGPKSSAVERAIAALQKGGAKVVAAVGNDGPSAPLAYPASYSGVIAVTGIDRTSAALMEAGKAGHVDFAAPAANLIAAVPGKGFMAVRGTSFAVPLVAGRLALAGSVIRLAREASPGKGEVGLGVVCGKCGVAPEAIAKRK